MTTSVSRDGGAFADVAPELLDSLFYAVSHDLRSPLLTVSLSAQLLEHTLGEVAQADGTREALGGLQAACDDLERMLNALNALSRAKRRASAAVAVALGSICVGAPSGDVGLDETTASELRGVIPAGATASVGDGVAVIRWGVEDVAASPLRALAGSLHSYAGGPVEALACLEIALERHGGSLGVDGGQVEVRLPVTTGAAS